VRAAAAAYSKQHGRGPLGDWTRCDVNHAESITWSISVLNTHVQTHARTVSYTSSNSHTVRHFLPQPQWPT